MQRPPVSSNAAAPFPRSSVVESHSGTSPIGASSDGAPQAARRPRPSLRLEEFPEGSLESSGGGSAVLQPPPPLPQTLQQVLMQHLPLGERRCVFGLFASLERRSLSLADLSAVFMTYQQLLEPFTAAVLENLGGDVFPSEFQLIRYLLSPGEVTGGRVEQNSSSSSSEPPAADAFLEAPFIAWPLHTLLQAWYFLLTARRYGWGPVTALLAHRVGRAPSATTGGLLALGKGVFAMLAVSEAASGGEAALPRTVAKYMRGAYGVGRSLYIHHEQQRLSRAASAVAFAEAFSPACQSQLLVVNVPVPVLQVLVDTANSDAAACMAAVQVGRVVTPRASLVVGHPADLARLQVLLEGFSAVSGTKLHTDPLPSTTPVNSRFYNTTAVQELLRTWLELEFRVDPSHLHLPCCLPSDPPVTVGGAPVTAAAAAAAAAASFTTGSSSALPFGAQPPTGDRLMRLLAETVLCSTQSFLPALEAVVGTVNTYILDFTAARLNVGQLLAWSYPTEEEPRAAAAARPDADGTVAAAAAAAGGGNLRALLGSAATAVQQQPPTTTVISLPSDKPVTSILPTPKRSGEAPVLRSTLQKCAVLNELLGMAHTAEHSGSEAHIAVASFPLASPSSAPSSPSPLSFRSGDATFASVGLIDPASGAITPAGACFTLYLLEATSVAFPRDVLQKCRSVLTLLEMWEALEMTGQKHGSPSGGIRTGGRPGLLVSTAGGRKA